MIKNINSQLTANAKSLEWTHVYLKDREQADFRQKLISNRIKLKRLLYAKSVNPAAAIFGESQVGKSYMVDCLLTGPTSVLNIYDGEGKPTGFLESINPLGKGKEATSLISRFTTKQVWCNKDYPVRATMLSPIDVVIVLLDGYFNDVKNHDFPREDAVKAEILRVQNRYAHSQPVQHAITEDEIYELKDYLTSDLVTKGEAFRFALKDTNYFEQLSMVIDRVPVEQWADVLEFLWNKNEILTAVFRKLISTLKTLGFAKTVYIKLDAVLRQPGTILHVDRLYELFGVESFENEKGEQITIDVASVPNMDVLTDGGRQIGGVKKSEFCALAMELAFTIVNVNVDNTEFFENKPFLEHSDILDFPGARSRKEIEASEITHVNACEMILRGKVAYLFNKYSQQFLITNLLFCHHDIKSEVVTLSSLLKGWVENAVGKTPEERRDFMQIAEVPPLFLIGTKFNIDLTLEPDDSKGNEEDRAEKRHYRWTKRFGMLTNLIAPSASNTWLNEWVPGVPFKNTYLLRSFEYSCQYGIFEGYQVEGENGLWKLVYGKDGKLQGETGICDKYKWFLPLLKESFLSNSFAQTHFADPVKSWDEAVSVGKDGSKWIIENLTRSSSKMQTLRDTQFGRAMDETFNNLINLLCSKYHDDNTEMELKKQMATVSSIMLTFDGLFGRDKYFFTDFISSMLVDEEELHDVVLDIANNAKVVNETDLSELFAIRARAKIDNNLPFEENKNRLKKSYSAATDAELEAKLKERGLTIEDIINPKKVMSFSRMIADAVEREWMAIHLDVKRYKEFVDRGLSEKELDELLLNTRQMYTEVLHLSDKIAMKIHPYVSSAKSVRDLADMLADICSEMINKFVNTVGIAYIDDQWWIDAKDMIEREHLDVSTELKDCDELQFDAEGTRTALPAVFDTFENVDKILNEIPVDMNKLVHFSNYQEYMRWIDCMKLSFIATNGIPKYGAENDALREIFLQWIVNQEGLKDLVAKNEKLNALTFMQAQDENN